MSTVGFNFHVILPLLASDTLDAGPEVFGLLSAAFGGGALAGALLTAALGRASWKLLLLGTTSFSLSLLALAPVRDRRARRRPVLFVTGVSFTLWTSNANTILQLGAPDPSAAASSACSSSPSPASRRSAASSPAGSSRSAARS